jgi:hypothetical protein
MVSQPALACCGRHPAGKKAGIFMGEMITLLVKLRAFPFKYIRVGTWGELPDPEMATTATTACDSLQSETK